jgi:hypothetical protein
MAALVTCCLALSPALAAAPAPTTTKAPPTPVAAGKEALAREFAALYVPDDLVRAGAAREFEKSFVASFNGVPANAALEARFPGSRTAGLRAGQASLSAFYDQALPKLRGAVADAAALQLNVAQLAELNAFYRSPVGQRTIRAVAENLDTTALVARAKADPAGFQMKPGDIQQMITPKTIAQLQASDQAALIRFGASPIGRTFAALRPRIEGALLTTQNTEMAAHMPKLQAAVGAAIAAHVKSATPAK